LLLVIDVLKTVVTCGHFSYLTSLTVSEL